MAKKLSGRRSRGHVRRRGNSYQVLVYAGNDPLTGKELRLTESTTDEAEAYRILKRLSAQVDEQSHARTKATFRAAMETWLRVHEVEETTPRELRKLRAVLPLPRLRRRADRENHAAAPRGILR